MSNEQIEALRSMEAAATPGPWAAYIDCDPQITADLRLSAVMRNTLLRTLEERERLLAALRRCEPDRHDQHARDAIDFAEAAFEGRR